MLGVDPADLEADGRFVVCYPDLEGVYVEALGVERVLELLLASPSFTDTSIRNACDVELTDMTVPALSDYCRNKKRKIRAALALAAGLTAAEAEGLPPVADIVRAASA